VIIGAILAGGAGRRLGGVAKATLQLGNATLLARVQARLVPQTPRCILSVGPQHLVAAWAHESGLPLVVDAVADAGPLAGVAAAVAWAAAQGAAGVVTVPVDVPFVPTDLIARLAATPGSLGVACSGARTHHAVAYWPTPYADALAAAVARGDAALHRWQANVPLRPVSWAADAYDPFFNINTADDLRAALEIAQLVDAPESAS
jgi:molybdopterin-guanine dinucleotide biosynthesis protein A